MSCGYKQSACLDVHRSSTNRSISREIETYDDRRRRSNDAQLAGDSSSVPPEEKVSFNSLPTILTNTKRSQLSGNNQSTLCEHIENRLGNHHFKPVLSKQTFVRYAYSQHFRKYVKDLTRTFEIHHMGKTHFYFWYFHLFCMLF